MRRDDLTKPCILREFLGGSEEQNFDQWATSTIQDHEVALEIAAKMLSGFHPCPYNADQPEFYEEFTITDGEALRLQMEAFKGPEPRYWLLDAANSHNKLSEVRAAIGHPTVGLVDDAYGAVIAYVVEEAADELCDKLNKANNA